MPEENRTSELSEREKELLIWVATGISNKEIATRLSISANTVKVHLRNIFAKIGVASRTEAAVWAIKQGLAKNVIPQPQTNVENPNTAEDNEPLVDQSSQAPKWHWKPIFWIVVAAAGLLLLPTAFWLVTGPAFRNESTPTPSSVRANWVSVSAMTDSRSAPALLAWNNRIYVLGGLAEEQPSAAFEEYTITSDRWTKLGSLPEALSEVNAAVTGGMIYLFGGIREDGSISQNGWTYDFEVGKWSEAGSLPFELSHSSIASYEGKIYVFGGKSENGWNDSIWRFDPTDQSWIALGKMPDASSNLFVAYSSESIYVLDAEAEKGFIYRYSPAAKEPWENIGAIPKDYRVLGVTDIADMLIFLCEQNQTLLTSMFLLASREWRPWNSFGAAKYCDQASVVFSGTNVYCFHKDATFTNKVVYSVLLPVIGL